MKVLLAEDDQFFVERLKDILPEYIEDLELHIVRSKKKIIQTVNDFLPNIIIMDLIFPDGKSIDLIEIFKHDYPDVDIIITSAQSDIRLAVNTIKKGADHYIVKDKGFNSDLFLALNSIFDKMRLRNQIRKLNESIFAKENYPMVIFKASENGVDLVDQDFIEFPERLPTTEKEFLQKIGLNTLIALGQGHTYAQGCYNLPAGESQFFELFIFTIVIPDPGAVDKRMSQGFFQLCLFVPKSFCAMFPSTLELSELIPNIKEIIPSSEIISYQALDKVKELILNFVISYQF